MTRTRSVTAGLILLGVLSLLDAPSLLLTDDKTPPIEVAAIGTALGVVCLVLLVFAWRGSRGSLIARHRGRPVVELRGPRRLEAALFGPPVRQRPPSPACRNTSRSPTAPLTVDERPQ